MTGAGMLWMIAPILPTKEMTMAITAAPPITHTLNTRVMAMTPIFSP